MKDCIFCKIVNDELPSYKIYEDDYILAFLDLSQETIGHTLIIPKSHYENIFETPEDILAMINIIAKKISIDLKFKLNFSGVNILNSSGKDAQQDVFHLHYHIIPRYKDSDFKIKFERNNSREKNLETIYNKIKK